ncbi:MAG: hypothetical protein M1825_002950 [Sarcosagium campestre]|nr:MAG: hypothetical protein M1825_002950 [Sarcosagium campestre]
MFVNAAYYLNQRVYDNQLPSSLKLQMISHVFYAFAKVDADGTVQLGDRWADAEMPVDGQLGCLRAFAALKQSNPHLKVILSVGGGAGSAHFPSAASCNRNRQRFARTARSIVHDFGLDGIDVDWESPASAEEGRHYVKLMAALRDHFPRPELLLTSAWPAGAWALKHINVGEAQSFLDYINLMAYDFSGPWVTETGHLAQLHAPTRPHNEASRLSGESAVRYLGEHGVPRAKILLGVPVYGRSFLRASKIGQRYTGHGGHDGAFIYKDLPRPGAAEYVDGEAMAACCEGGDGGFVSYDNHQTVEAKGRYVMSNGLGGIFYWTGTGDALGERSLVAAGYRGMFGSSRGNE